MTEHMDEIAGHTHEAARLFDIANPPTDYFQNPAPYFKMLRDHDPIHANKDGSVLLTRFEDVRAVWRDLSGTVEKADYFRSRFGEGDLLEHFTTSMLFRDPPDHDRLRAILNPFFRPKVLANFEANIVRIVEQLLFDIKQRGRCDFVADFAYKLPTSAICLAIGFDPDDGEYIHSLAHKMLVALNPNANPSDIAAGNEATGIFKRYVLRCLNEIRQETSVDETRNMLSALVAAEQGGQVISEDEMVHSAIVMFNGGHGTTMHLLAASLFHLTEFPEVFEELRQNPQLMSTAFDEFVRFVTPVQLHWRRTTKRVEISSGVLEANTEVLLCAGSANRDETIFTNPNGLDLKRNPNPHISFGSGAHICIGRPLSKLEVVTAVPMLLAEFKNIRRAGPASFAPLPKFRALTALPIELS